MNPRQRRGVLLIAVAGIGAAAVFVLVSNYLADVRSQLGPTVAVVVSTEDLPPFATPSAGSLSTVELPRRWLPPNALQDPEAIGGRVAATSIPADTILSEGMFMAPPTLAPGEREIAILVDAETGVGGKLQRGSRVDVYASFAAEEGGRPSARIVVQNAEIIEVGSPVDVPEDGVGPGSVGFGSGQRLPVTFRLTIEDANRLVFVESFALSVRLALRAPGDDGITDPGRTIFDQLGRLGREFDPVGADAVSEPEEPPPPPPPPPSTGDEDADEDDLDTDVDADEEGDA